MNTEGEKIQWHPAFDAALQIELGEEAKYLTFEPEHLLSKKPMQIDVLVKNEKKVKIRKNIGRIFRQHNIIEYKSPEDHLNIDDFYKVYGYTCIYKTEVEKVNQIPAEELTITFVCYHYPRQMLRNLQNERNINVKNIENGIYYLYGDAIPIQLIIVPELSIENNYWLNKLRNNLKSGGEIKLFMEQYEKNRLPNGFHSYRHAAPPHSTAVKPVRAGASSVCGAISTGADSGLKAIKTRMSVSGSGVMVRRALLV